MKHGALGPVFVEMLAEWTGLEPATPGVTGRYSNQLNYHSLWLACSLSSVHQVPQTWRPLGDSNPCNHRERVVS